MALPAAPLGVAAITAPCTPIKCSHLTVNASNVPHAIDWYLDPAGAVAAGGAVDWAKTKIMRQKLYLATEEAQRTIAGKTHKTYNGAMAPTAHRPWA